MADRVLAHRVTIKDCRVDTFRTGGPGGQKQNKTSSGVRVTHEPSGASAESREERSQLQNKKRAFTKMAESRAFQSWARLKAAAISESLEKAADRQMRPENLLVEYYDPDVIGSQDDRK